MIKTIEHKCECGDCELTFTKVWNSPRRFYDAKHREAWRRTQPKKVQKYVHQKKCGIPARRKFYGEAVEAVGKTCQHHSINWKERTLQGT